MGWKPANDLIAPVGAPLATEQPVGYAFEAQGTQHVVYQDFTLADGAGGHVHELWWSVGGATHHKDLTDRADAPAIDGAPTGYVFEAERTQHVVYVGRDGRIYELWWEDGDPHLNKLGERAGAPRAVSGSRPTGYAAEAEGMQHVFYLAERTADEDRHIHEIYWKSGSQPSHGALKHPDLASRPESDPSAYFFNAQGTHHVFYKGFDEHIHEFSWRAGGPTRHNDLNVDARPCSDGSKPSLASAQPKGYVFDGQGTQHVVYVGKDQHIHEFWWDPSEGWHSCDLTSAAGGPPALPAGGVPAGYVATSEQTQHVVYVEEGSEGRIHELWWDPSGWHYHNLSQATGAPPAISVPWGYFFGREGTQHVIYIDIDHHVIELYWVP